MTIYQSVFNLQQNDVGVNIMPLLWVIVQIIHLVILVWPSEDLIEAVEETAPTISRYMNKEMTLDVRNKLELFQLQLLHHSASFSAQGVLSIRRHILTSIASSVTTYLVSLI